MSRRCIATVVCHGRYYKPAVSLPEVLVVCALILFLLALLVPSLNSARERARRVVCSNNLRQWGAALQFYRDENNDYLPQEGHHGSGINKRGTWYNELPPYLGLPPYKDLEGANEAIRELPNIHVWICPSKNLTAAYKSGSGKNQFHYGMNQVLDGLGDAPNGSRDTPGFPEKYYTREADTPLPGKLYDGEPHTVFMFDIVWNSPAGTPRDVATMYQRGHSGGYLGKFHGDYANVLYLTGAVGNCKTDDLVSEHDFRRGDIVWEHPRLYWGYPPR